ncbi:MAG TPA: hypothetical protein VFW64_21505 [Pseudonocardiaceae bacterium]|nr:hypothetical protein [Pseudonocardiaceae bacterium]
MGGPAASLIADPRWATALVIAFGVMFAARLTPTLPGLMPVAQTILGASSGL